jgi:hypothetical protein
MRPGSAVEADASSPSDGPSRFWAAARVDRCDARIVGRRVNPLRIDGSGAGVTNRPALETGLPAAGAELKGRTEE